MQNNGSSSVSTKTLIEQILQNPESINNFNEEKISKLEKELSPLGIVLPAAGAKKLVNMSILNLRDDYLRRLHMTSLIGYVYRTLEEYDPFEFKDLFEDARNNTIKETYNCGGSELTQAQIKKIVKLFLDKNFNFNPDLHVRQAGKTHGNESKTATTNKEAVAQEILKIRDRCSNSNTADLPLSKKISETIVSKFASHIPTEGGLREQFTKSIEMLERSTSDYSALVAATTKDVIQSITTIIKTVESAGLSNALSDEVGILAKNRNKLSALRTILEPTVEAKIAETGKHTVNTLPPADVFHHWERYLNNHYEIMRDIVAALYYEQPDIEFAVQLYNAFEGEKAEEDAKKHRLMHESALICPMLTIETGSWTLLGPFKENRDRLEFYNKNAEMLKKIFEQAEADTKLGGQLVKKVVHKSKAKNIRDFGPDNQKGLEEYQAIVGTVDRLRSKPALTKEEKDALFEAQRQKEMLEVPDDAIQMDVFKPDEAGGLTRDKIYIEAEDPKYLNDPDISNNIDISKLGPIQPRTDSFASESAIFGAHKSMVGTDQQVRDMGFDKEKSLADATNNFIGVKAAESNNSGGNTANSIN